MRRRLPPLLGLAVLGACLASAGSAQAPLPGAGSGAADAPAAPAPPPPEPEVVAIAEFASRSEVLRRELRRTRTELADDATFERISEAIAGIANLLPRRAERARDRLADRPELSRLNQLQSEWGARRSQLDGWNDALASRVERLQDAIDSLDETRALWSRSLVAAREESAPSELIATIREDLGMIDEVGAEAKRQRDRVLRLQGDLSGYEAAVTGILETVALARRQARETLFEPQVPPLWLALSSPDPAGEGWGRLRGAVAGEAREVASFVQEVRRALPGAFVLYALTAVAALWLRRRLRARAEGGRLEGPAQVFDRPWSVASLVALLLVLGSLPFAPLLVRQAIGLVLIVPAVRLITPVVHPSVLPLLSAVLGFFLVDRVRDLLEAVPLLERLVFLAETLAAAVLVARLLRPSRLAGIPREDQPPELLGYGMRLALALFTGATIANVLGLMALARVLGEGTLIAVYAGLLAFALYRLATTSILLLLGSRHARRLASVRASGATLVRWSRRLLATGLFALWAMTTLRAYLVWDPVLRVLSDAFTTPVALGDVSIALEDVATFALTLFAGFALSRALRSILIEDVTPRMRLARGVGHAIGTLTAYVVLVGAFLLAVAAAGLDLSSFALIVGALSVGIGIGLQDVVNNFVCGLILLFERPVQVGDLVQVGTLTGHMTRIGIRSSTLLTFEGSEVVLPNSRLVSDEVVNWTLSNARRRIDVPVGVAYGSDHGEVLRVLDQAARSVPEVLADPPPFVVFSGFGDSSLDFEVRFWAFAADFLVARNGVVAAIYEGLGRDGVEIPFPQRDLHVRSLPPGLLGARGDAAES